MIFKIMLFILLTTSTSYAADEWSKKDIGLQIAYTIVHVIDWGQTLDDSIDEINPVIGKNPSRPKVHTYFALTLIGHTVISYVLPSKYRGLWQSLTIGMEAGCIYRNYRLGVRVNF